MACSTHQMSTVWIRQKKSSSSFSLFQTFFGSVHSDFSRRTMPKYKWKTSSIFSPSFSFPTFRRSPWHTHGTFRGYLSSGQWFILCILFNDIFWSLRLRIFLFMVIWVSGLLVQKRDLFMAITDSEGNDHVNPPSFILIHRAGARLLGLYFGPCGGLSYLVCPLFEPEA